MYISNKSVYKGKFWKINSRVHTVIRKTRVPDISQPGPICTSLFNDKVGSVIISGLIFQFDLFSKKIKIIHIWPIDSSRRNKLLNLATLLVLTWNTVSFSRYYAMLRTRFQIAHLVCLFFSIA